MAWALVRRDNKNPDEPVGSYTDHNAAKFLQVSLLAEAVRP